MVHTYSQIMSFVASARFLIGATADQLLPHQCLLCGKFCFDRGVCASFWAGAEPISAPLFHAMVSHSQTNYAANAEGHHQHLRRSKPDLLVMIFCAP